MKSVLIFDLYGVLKPDTYENWLALHGLQREGVYQTLAEQLDTEQLSQQDFFTALAQFTGTTTEDIRDYFDSGTAVPPETFTHLDLLSQQYRLGLISNGSIHTRSMLEKVGLAHFFEVIIISAEVGITKPNTEIYKKALEALSIAPSEAIFIDDNPNNTQGARKCGIDAIEFTGFENLHQSLNHALHEPSATS